MLRTDFVACARAHFAACAVAERFINTSILPIAQRSDLQPEDVRLTYVNYLVRTILWLRTMGKLDNSGDFQAATAGARSLFEVVVDLTLFAHDPECPAQKMLDWETSAKHKAAKSKIEILRKRTDAHAAAVLAINEGAAQRDEAPVRELRQKWWQGNHPPRWTGRPLVDDAKRCDDLTQSQHGDYYRLRFVELCWTTHGSAFVGIRYFDENAFVTVMASAFQDVVMHSQAVSRLVLTLLNRLDPIVEERFRALHQEILESYAGAFGATPGA